MSPLHQKARRRNSLSVLAFFIFCFSCPTLSAQQNGNPAAGYFTIENYYKAKWGYAEEFIELWKKNHYPLLKKAREKGDIISITASTPQLHSGEDSRWDFKVSIVFRNSALAFDPELTKPYKALLYPDADKLGREEQHRFELLLAHWDVPVTQLDLK